MAKTATLSPLEELQQLQARMKELKSQAGEAMVEDAKAHFLPLHEQFKAAVAAVVDSEQPERAAIALKWIGDNIGEFKKLGKLYHKHVFNVAAPRKPRTPKSDAPTEDAGDE